MLSWGELLLVNNVLLQISVSTSILMPLTVTTIICSSCCAINCQRPVVHDIFAILHQACSTKVMSLACRCDLLLCRREISQFISDGFIFDVR
jgi:hypothetical protein